MQKIWRPPEIYDCRRLYLGEAGCFMEKNLWKGTRGNWQKIKKRKEKKEKANKTKF